MKEENKCAQCDKKFKGCPCSLKKADDGKLVHPSCLRKYNYILKIKKEESE